MLFRTFRRVGVGQRCPFGPKILAVRNWPIPAQRPDGFRLSPPDVGVDVGEGGIEVRLG